MDGREVFYEEYLCRLFGRTWSWKKVAAEPRDRQRVADILEQARIDFRDVGNFAYVNKEYSQK